MSSVGDSGNIQAMYELVPHICKVSCSGGAMDVLSCQSRLVNCEVDIRAQYEDLGISWWILLSGTVYNHLIGCLLKLIV